MKTERLPDRWALVTNRSTEARLFVVRLLIWRDDADWNGSLRVECPATGDAWYASPLALDSFYYATREDAERELALRVLEDASP